MLLIVLWLGKTTYILMKLLGRHGAALPGLVIETLSPKFLATSLSKLPQGVIVVTGTNGKTTSTKMLSSIARHRYRVLTNPTGSNFTRGMVSAVARHSSWLGKLDYDIAIFEIDEAYAAKFASNFSPRGTVVLNVMRDQMDRFGEIDYTADLIGKVVAKTIDFVILNSNDQRVVAMKNNTKAKIKWFGVSAGLRKLYINDDELHNNKLNLRTDIINDIELTSIGKEGIIELSSGNNKLTTRLEASTTYNSQNAAAVALAAKCLGFSDDEITTYLTEVKPAFGRGEHLKIFNKNIILQLVKNPGGFRQALISSKNITSNAVMVAINDEYADGRDVSWLWDVEFSGYINNKVSTSGTRAADMALRLKYDDITVDNINTDLDSAIKELLNNISVGQTAIIYTTYTAMLKLRKIIAKQTKVDKI